MNTTSWHYSVKALANSNITSLPLNTEKIISLIEEKGYEITTFSSSNSSCIQKLQSLGIEIPSQIAFTVSYFDFKAVYYNKTLPSHEILFALAHEYGHICLSPSVFSGILGKSDSPEKESKQEQEADDFALNLLAPTCILAKLKPRTIGEIQKLTLLSSEDAYSAYNNIKNIYILSEDEELVLHNFSNFIKRYILKKYWKGIVACLFVLLSVSVLYFLNKNNVNNTTETPQTVIATPAETVSSLPVPQTLPTPTPTTLPTSGADLENYAVATVSGKRYHIPECFHIKTKTNLRRLSVADAEAEGLTPCLDCIDK